MKIATDAQEMTEQHKKHALKVLGEMIHSIETIEESYTLFCHDEENKQLVKRLLKEFNEEESDGVPVEESMAFFHKFKMKARTEYNRLHASINKYN